MWEFYSFLFLLVVGYGVGTYLERSHFASIRRREQELINKAIVFTVRDLPELPGNPQLRLVAAGTVVSIDYFKRIVAMLHHFFGGNISSYESLLERARREAILRMREKAHAIGATMIFGVRLETSAINDGNPKTTTGVELIAYGTAIIPDHTAGATPQLWHTPA